MKKEQAIAILQESLRQNKVIRESPNTFFRCADIAGGMKNAEKRIEALNMAIAALCAQQAKLDRSRWEGCVVCNRCGVGGSSELLCNAAKAEYCPFCGRPLTEEAWVELERRINGGTTDNKT